MRFAVAALCVLALTGSAEARNPCAAYDLIPEEFRQTPTVDWTFYVLPISDVHIRCPGTGVLACAFENANNGTWTVLISDTLKGEEQTCAIQYEMAHMPPNYWADPAIEAPETIQWLAEQKTAYLKR